MKKLLSAITSIVLCGLMLTACGSNDSAETTDSAAADTTVAEETQAVEEETEATEEAAEETEAESEENAEAAGESYADLEAFSAADVFAIAGEEVEAKIIAIDYDAKKVSLSIRALLPEEVVEETPAEPEAPAEPPKGYSCDACGYVHGSETLEEDFVCPLCGVGADQFSPIYE